MNKLLNESILFANTETDLLEAINEIRILNAIGENREITIKLTSDIFHTKPIEINTPNITIDGCGYRIIGGIEINNWKSDTFNGCTCMSATVPENINNFTDLFVNGTIADATRYPKEGYLEILDSEVNNTTNFFDSSNFLATSFTTSSNTHLPSLRHLPHAMHP
jgi:hypothetical protein